MSPAADHVAAFDLAGRGFVFDTTDGHLLTLLTGGHTSLVTEAGFTSTGNLLTASVDGSLRVWDPSPADEQVTGSMPDNLCRVFGGRIDADSWQLAFGDEDLDPPCPAATPPAPSSFTVSTSADVGAVPPVATPRTVVLQDTFDSPTSAFASGEQQLGTGTLTTSIKGGRFRMEVSGVGAGYTAWSTAPVTGVGETWAVTATPGRSRGGCGVTAGDGAIQLTVQLDRDAGTGLLGWFGRVGITHTQPFTLPPDTSGDLTLAGDHGVIAVLLGGRRVATVSDAEFKIPTTAGFVTYGDQASCDVDEVSVATSP